MSMTKIGPKHQITIPKEVFEKFDLRVGEYVEVQAKGMAITIVPSKVIPKDQAWFHTPEWQAKEREADQDIARGKVSGPFTSAKDLIQHLEKRRPRKKR